MGKPTGISCCTAPIPVATHTHDPHGFTTKIIKNQPYWVSYGPKHSQFTVLITHSILNHCIVSPSSGWIYLIPTGPLALRWWYHSIDVAQPSTTYGILALICHCLPPSNHFASVWIASCQSWPPGRQTPSADSMKLGYHPQILEAWPDYGTYHCGGMWECSGERDNRDPKGDKVPLWDNRGALVENVFKEMIWFGFNASSFWFLYIQI